MFNNISRQCHNQSKSKALFVKKLLLSSISEKQSYSYPYPYPLELEENKYKHSKTYMIYLLCVHSVYILILRHWKKRKKKHNNQCFQ